MRALWKRVGNRLKHWWARLQRLMNRKRLQKGPSAAKIEPAATELAAAIRDAHLTWECARQRLDYVIEKDEIDYAIFALETAEKRYSMLLKEAKKIRWGAHQVYTSGMAQPVRRIGG